MSLSLVEIRATLAAGATEAHVLAGIMAGLEERERRRQERQALRARLLEENRTRESGFLSLTPQPASAPPPQGKAALRMVLVRLPFLRESARLVGGWLLERFSATGRCDPGLGDIARETGLVDRSVRRALAELEANRLVTRQVHRGRNHTNAYVIHWEWIEQLARQYGLAGGKPDSAENRTRKPDAGVRQTQKESQPSESVERVERARQGEMLLPIDGGRPARAAIASASAEQRVRSAVSAHLARLGPNGAARAWGEIGAETWSLATAAERDRHGTGIAVVLEALAPKPWAGPPETGPPPKLATG